MKNIVIGIESSDLSLSFLKHLLLCLRSTFQFSLWLNFNSSNWIICLFFLFIRFPSKSLLVSVQQDIPAPQSVPGALALPRLTFLHVKEGGGIIQLPVRLCSS